MSDFPRVLLAATVMQGEPAPYSGVLLSYDAANELLRDEHLQLEQLTAALARQNGLLVLDKEDE